MDSKVTISEKDESTDKRNDDVRLQKLVRVLVVDDEENIRNLYSLMLSKHGYVVAGSVSDGEQAVRAMQNVKTNSIDVIVMDYRLPRMDGLTAATIIKQINPNVKVILCSAFDDVVPTQLRAKTFDSVLKKPFSVKDLVKAIKGLKTFTDTTMEEENEIRIERSKELKKPLGAGQQSREENQEFDPIQLQH